MKTDMEYEKKAISDDEIFIDKVEGITEEEIKGLKTIFFRFIYKYKENPNRNPKEWLAEQLQVEMPEKSIKDIQKMADEIVESVEEYNRDLKDLNQKCKQRMTKESWLSDRIQDSAKGMSINQFGNYLYQIDKVIEQGTDAMKKCVLDHGMNPNLDGFIAEQWHVNNFNAKAVMEGSPFRASVCVPENGKYTKNSVDIRIDNIETKQIGVERYQSKAYSDTKTLIKHLKESRYPNQRLLVLKGQVEGVQKAIPSKTVTDHLGGTEKVPIRSDSLTKEQIKEYQVKAQTKGMIDKSGWDWNSYTTEFLAKNIGRTAGQAGVQAAFFGVGVNLAYKALKNEKIEPEEVVKVAIETGCDTGVKVAAGGALKAASEKGMISILPPGIKGTTIAKIACVGVENVKILWKVAKGELTLTEAAEHMGRTSVSMYAGLTTSAIGAGVGALALGWIPVVGSVVGGVIGSIAGYAVGSKFGECVFEGAKKVVKVGVNLVKRGVETAKNIVTGIKDFFLGRI